MAEAILNPNIESLDKESYTYQLYNSLVDAINRANSVDSPDFSSNPPMLLDEDGKQVFDPADPIVPLVDTEEIERRIKAYGEIQTKNYAYDLATAIISVAGAGGGPDGTGGYLPISGGSLTGRFTAKYGVELGDGGQTLITITHDGNGDPIGYFNLPMDIKGDVSIDGQLSLDDAGIWFNKHQTIYVADEVLNIDYQEINIKGDTNVDGTVKVGDVLIDGANGISFQGKKVYHAGNSNNKDADWTTNNLHVYGDLTLEKGSLDINGRLTALQGFDLGESGKKLLFSTADENGNGHVWLDTDLTILGYDNGIKFDDHYIIRTRSTDHDVISICAPGRTLNLGDSDDGVPTKSIALQADLRSSDNQTTLVSTSGRGFFMGLGAKSSLSGDLVMETYFNDSVDQGVLFNRQVAFKSDSGPKLYSLDNIRLSTDLPYTHLMDTIPITERFSYDARLDATTSPFRNFQDYSPTVCFDSDAQFFRFEKPVESSFFAIADGKHKTKLDDGLLFFDDGLFLEAVGNTIFHSGNATFSASLSSQVFSSGFAGSGWAILKDDLTGDYNATFDNLTIRKKARFYEFEVQKINVTNGSLWVSDACAGDTVEEIM